MDINDLDYLQKNHAGAECPLCRLPGGASEELREYLQKNRGERALYPSGGDVFKVVETGGTW